MGAFHGLLSHTCRLFGSIYVRENTQASIVYGIGENRAFFGSDRPWSSWRENLSHIASRHGDNTPSYPVNLMLPYAD